MIKRIGSPSVGSTPAGVEPETRPSGAPSPPTAKAKGWAPASTGRATTTAGSTFKPAAPNRSRSSLSGTEPSLMKETDRTQVSYQPVPGGQLFVDGLSYTDVSQGASGDCYFLSSMSAVAASNPQAVKRAITDNGDGTYSVRFFQKSHGQAKPVTVTVDAKLPYNAQKKGEEYATGQSDQELWVGLMEKAYAKWKGGYENIGQGGDASAALYALTGVKSDYTQEISKSDPDALWKQLKQASDQKRPMVAGTYDDKHQPFPYADQGLVEGHDYTVLGVAEENGQKTVTLRNPWGSQGWKGDLKPHANDDGIFTMPYAEFRRDYEDLSIMRAAP